MLSRRCWRAATTRLRTRKRTAARRRTAAMTTGMMMASDAVPLLFDEPLFVGG
jgi:hypothetical protein